MIESFYDYKRSTTVPRAFPGTARDLLGKSGRCGGGPVGQWRLVLDPLYEQFQRWKLGEISHDEIDEAIHKTHKSCQDV